LGFQKIRFYCEIYMTASILAMPLRIISLTIGGETPSNLSLIIWSVLMPINYYHNEHFRETLEKIGWITKE
jgi:hypothetical protein